jgi:hypothetical protein
VVLLSNGVRLTLSLRIHEIERIHQHPIAQSKQDLFDIVKVEASPIESTLRAYFDIYREWKPLLVNQDARLA